MSDEGLPTDVQSLLYEHIESYEQLETLLLLYRERTPSWTAERVGSRLNIAAATASDILAILRARQLIIRQSNATPAPYAYGPTSPALDATVRRLAEAYDNKRIEIIKLMSTNAIKRVRTSALRAFADAFVLNKDKNDG